MTGTIAFPTVYKRARAARPWRSLSFATGLWRNASLATGSWRSAGCAGLLVVAVLLAAGCSTDVSIGTPAAKEDDKLQTGSVTAASAAGEDQALPPAADLAYARRAAAEVLSRGGRDTSQAWENPQSGARGTVTPLASAYRVEGVLCRDFLASYVSDGGAESWLQGEACRAGKGANSSKGEWQVRRLKPWRN